MNCVIIESPYAGDSEEATQRNVRYAKACLLDSLNRGEAPFASHLLYTLVLDDSAPEQRKRGMEAGFAWRDRVDTVVFYLDLGISPGMQQSLEAVAELGEDGPSMVFRRLGAGWDAEEEPPLEKPSEEPPSKEPTFKVGDKVEFELASTLNEPRWDYDDDFGGSGTWGKGIVREIVTGDSTMLVRSKKGVTWWWPLRGNQDYSPDQWQRPGYLRHVKGET